MQEQPRGDRAPLGAQGQRERSGFVQPSAAPLERCLRRRGLFEGACFV